MLEEQHENFVAAVTMLAATNARVNERSEKKVNENTYDISSIKEVYGSFTL